MTDFFSLKQTKLTHGKVIRAFRKNFRFTLQEIEKITGIRVPNLSAIEGDKRSVGQEMATQTGIAVSACEVDSTRVAVPDCLKNGSDARMGKKAIAAVTPLLFAGAKDGWEQWREWPGDAGHRPWVGRHGKRAHPSHNYRIAPLTGSTVFVARPPLAFGSDDFMDCPDATAGDLRAGPVSPTLGLPKTCSNDRATFRSNAALRRASSALRRASACNCFCS